MGTYRQPVLDQYYLNRGGPDNDVDSNATDNSNWYNASGDENRSDGYGAATVEDNVPAVTPDFNWSNPTNAQGYAVNNMAGGYNGATIAPTGTQPYTLSTLRFSDFGFNIPSAATIVGVEVGILIGSTENEFDFNAINVAWGTSAANLSATTKGSGVAMPAFASIDYYHWFGGSADMWGETTTNFNPTNFNTTDFGFVFQPSRNDSPATTLKTLEVTSGRMVVHYTFTETGDHRVTQVYGEVIADTESTTARKPRVFSTYAEVITSAASTTPGSGGGWGSGMFAPIIVT